MLVKLILPLFVWNRKKTKADKRIYLNKNIERKLHYTVYNKIKKEYVGIVSEALGKKWKPIPHGSKVKCTYTLYPKSKRRTDLGNPLSIVCKFTEDALVALSFMEDDNYNIVSEIVFLFGEVDKESPRCELVIEEIEQSDIPTC